MGIRLEDSASHLWRSAPYWRVSVVAAAAFTVAWVVHLGYLALGNPDSDARLTAYVSAERRAERMSSAGERCEQIAQAFAKLTAEDSWRSGANRTWQAAVADGDACRKMLAGSDSRFEALAQAVSAAETNPASVQVAADAFRSLDAFDRSRQRFRDDAPVVEKAERYVEAVAASDRRLAALAQQTAGFERTHASADALGVVDALNEVTALGRARSSSGPRQQVLNEAEAVDRSVLASRAKLSQLASRVRAAESEPTPESERQLVEDVAAVTPFDEGVAAKDQRQTLEQARVAATDVAWKMLGEKVAAAGQSGSPSDYEAVAVPYRFLKDTAAGGLTAEQRALLSKAAADSDALVASDARLSDLLKAESAWQQQGVAGGDAVLGALGSVTPFDQARFDAAHKQAWESLSRAKMILDGPKVGFTSGTKDRLWIFVAAADKTASTGEVADALNGALRRAGFQVAATQKDAALVANVAVESVEDPKADLSGGFMEWVSTARIGVRTLWAANGKPLFAAELVETARARDKGAVQAQALLAGVDAIVARFETAAQSKIAVTGSRAVSTGS